MPTSPETGSLNAPAIAAIRAGDRRALARAITLVESSAPGDQAPAARLLEALGPPASATWRLGIAGAPGVGKSTFVEAFGLHALGQGRRVAVLAVDPSSITGGGAILGDKTRMERLARAPQAFIRPQPSLGEAGGVARGTRDAVLLVEAAGYNLTIVEAVGGGQSEAAVAALADMFLLLLAPAAGDGIQGVKRGVMELADLVLVNKADGELAAAAHRAVADHRAAMALMRPHEAFWTPPVAACSALTGAGIAAAWQTVERYFAAAAASLAAKRAHQARQALQREVLRLHSERLHANPGTDSLARRLEQEVAAGRLPPRSAARRLLETQPTSLPQPNTAEGADPGLPPARAAAGDGAKRE